ncbi:MAG: nucleotidyltransferase domain-containing protein [Cyanobium sp. CZS 48M]|nr:nucleotidyltransferase domain-containing protein [Cyanobium sp. CZS48M]
MAHQWLKWPRPATGAWDHQPCLVAKLHAQLTGPAKLELVRSVFRLHPEVMSATLFGSRAKGTHSDRSDVDLVVAGDIEPLRAEAIAAELEELPLPYRFDVQSLAHIQHRPLLEHIQRVGILIYPAP